MVAPPLAVPDPDAAVRRRTRSALRATAAVFVVNGATFSNWLPRIPEIRDHLGLGNAGLGATLLGGGLGGVVGALVVGRLSDRLGSAHLLRTAALTLSIGMPLIAFAPHARVLLVLLTVLGAFDVFNDVAMNAQAVMVQERLRRQVMNRMHAMWSLGFTGGALAGSLARAAGVGVRWHLVLVGAALGATVLVCHRSFIAVDTHEAPVASPVRDTRRRPGPTWPMLAMALAALGAITLEVAPNDWAAVFFADVHDAGRLSGFATLACAGAMLVARLAGDDVLERIGEQAMVRLAITLVAAGVAITVVAPHPSVAVAGLVLWGLGLAPVFPLLYTSAARLPDTSAGAGLGWMVLGQRTGAIVTSVAMGSISQWEGMRVGFGAVAGAALVLLALSLRAGSAARRAEPTPLTPG